MLRLTNLFCAAEHRDRPKSIEKASKTHALQFFFWIISVRGPKSDRLLTKTDYFKTQNNGTKNSGYSIRYDDSHLGCVNSVNHPEKNAQSKHDIHHKRNAWSIPCTYSFNCLWYKWSRCKKSRDITENGQHHKKPLQSGEWSLRNAGSVYKLQKVISTSGIITLIAKSAKHGL